MALICWFSFLESLFKLNPFTSSNILCIQTTTLVEVGICKIQIKLSLSDINKSVSSSSRNSVREDLISPLSNHDLLAAGGGYFESFFILEMTDTIADHLHFIATPRP